MGATDTVLTATATPPTATATVLTVTATKLLLDPYTTLCYPNQKLLTVVRREFWILNTFNARPLVKWVAPSHHRSFNDCAATLYNPVNSWYPTRFLLSPLLIQIYNEIQKNKIP